MRSHTARIGLLAGTLAALLAFPLSRSLSKLACTTEMPAMQASFDKLRDKGFVVLAVNELEDDAKVRDHIRQYGHTFPVLMDRDNKVANQFGVFGLPVSVFIDPQGRVQEYIKGGLLTEQMIHEVVAKIQKQEPIKAASLQ